MDKILHDKLIADSKQLYYDFPLSRVELDHFEKIVGLLYQQSLDFHRKKLAEFVDNCNYDCDVDYDERFYSRTAVE